MFGGVLTILIAIWVYRTAASAKVSNILLWTASAAVFLLLYKYYFIISISLLLMGWVVM